MDLETTILEDVIQHSHTNEFNVGYDVNIVRLKKTAWSENVDTPAQINSLLFNQNKTDKKVSCNDNEGNEKDKNDPYAISSHTNHVYENKSTASFSSRASSINSLRSNSRQKGFNDSQNSSISQYDSPFRRSSRLLSPASDRKPSPTSRSGSDDISSSLLNPLSSRKVSRESLSLGYSALSGITSYRSGAISVDDANNDGKNVRVEREDNEKDTGELVRISHNRFSKISLGVKSAPAEQLKHRLENKEQRKKLELSRSKSSKSNTRVTSATMNKKRATSRSSKCERRQQSTTTEKRKAFGSSKKLTILEKISVLEARKLDGVKKSIQLKEEENFLEEKIKDLKANEEIVSRRTDEIKNLLLLAKRDFQTKMKLRKNEEMKRRKIENELRKQERIDRDREIAEKKRELETLPLEKIQRIEELQDEIKQLEANTFKMEQMNRKTEKEKRLRFEIEEKKFITQEQEREEGEMKLAEEIQGHHSNEVKSIETKLRTIKEEKEKHESARLLDEKKIDEDIFRLKQREKERLEAAFREQMKLEEEEKEAVRLAMIEIEKKKQEFARRRAFNVELKQSLENSKRNQLVTRPYSYSYFINIPKKMWELPIGWKKSPRYRAGGSKLQ